MVLRRAAWLVLIALGVLAADTPVETPGPLPSPAVRVTLPAPEQPAEGAPSPTPRPPLRDGKATVYRIPIEGMIDLGMAPFVKRVVEEAATGTNGVVLLDINTFGGRVDAAVLIRDSLIDAKVPTIAFVNHRAISAGALISLACERIVMTPGSTIGAATPVTGGGNEKMEAADEKVVSYMRTEMRATAERRGRNGDIAEAMVDKDVEIEGVIEAGKVLTLTNDRALELGVAEHQADDLAGALAAVGLGGAEILERRLNWAEKIARAISHPVLSSFLLSIGFLGIMIEIYQPGWGLPGTLGIACLLAFFFGHQVVQLAGLGELLLFALGLVLVAVEIFVLPGFGVAGILGVGLIAVSVVLSMLGLDLRVSWDLGFVHDALTVMASTVLMTTAFAILAFRLLPKTGATRFLVLRSALASGSGFDEGTAPASGADLGTVATALTDLRPAGKVRLDDGQRRDAVTEGGFIAKGARVHILQWRTDTAVVRVLEDRPSSGVPLE